MEREETGEQEGVVLTFRQACERLGLSEKTLRKRIRAGMVEAWQVEGACGKEWRLRLPALAGQPQEIREPPAPEPEPLPATGQLVVTDPTAVPLSLYQDLLTRHEQAMQRLGRLEAETARLPALEAGTAAQAAEVREVRDRELALVKQQQQKGLWGLVGWGVALALLVSLAGVLLLFQR
jgi:excisionase family DNA binding protein